MASVITEIYHIVEFLIMRTYITRCFFIIYSRLQTIASEDKFASESYFIRYTVLKTYRADSVGVRQFLDVEVLL